MSTRLMQLLVRVCLAVVFIAGCTPQRGWEVIEGAPPPPPGSTIEIEMIEPAIGSVLRAGETVTFKAALRYRVTSKRGMIQLMAQDSSLKHLGRQVRYVNGGSGTQQIELEIKVPEDSSLTLYAPLMNQAQATTTVVASETYSIVKSR